MVRCLTGLDGLFVGLEGSNNPMQVGMIIVMDPATAPGGCDFGKIQALLEDRLAIMAPFRRRLVPVPFGLHHPVWIEDPDLDLDRHLKHVRLPAPGGHAELLAYMSKFIAGPLDRSRPLWEVQFLEGLEGGLVALIGKVHHAAIDGVAGIELASNLLDLTPDTRVVSSGPRPWQVDSHPTPLTMTGYAARSLARQPRAAFEIGRNTVAMTRELRDRNRREDVVAPPGPFDGPRTSLNRPITADRKLVTADVELAEIKRVKNALGGTVNDVVMAMCAGALRRYFVARGEKVERDLVAMVPISVRPKEGESTHGNQLSAMLVSLATTVDDPVERMRAVQRSTQAAKDQEQVASFETLLRWAELSPPAVTTAVRRAWSWLRVGERIPPLINVHISNIPGPAIPLYSAGCEIRAIYPMGPIMDSCGLNITVMSYLGHVHFGLLACPTTVPELDDLGRYLFDALADLSAAADAVSGSRVADPSEAR